MVIVRWLNDDTEGLIVLCRTCKQWVYGLGEHAKRNLSIFKHDVIRNLRVDSALLPGSRCARTRKLRPLVLGRPLIGKSRSAWEAQEIRPPWTLYRVCVFITLVTHVRWIQRALQKELLQLESVWLFFRCCNFDLTIGVSAFFQSDYWWVILEPQPPGSLLFLYIIVENTSYEYQGRRTLLFSFICPESGVCNMLYTICCDK